ncbi:MAG: ATP-dependent DNA helicase [Candidatus Micrarchaeia archaeon]
MDFFRFDTPREHQLQAIKDIYKALSEQKSILVNAPTGIGKTDAVLSAALHVATEKNLDVFFLTPKISQHKIAIDSLAGINERFDLKIKFSDLVGKKNLCTNPEANSMDGEAFYKECERLIKNGKCPYFSAFKNSVNNIPEAVSAASLHGHNMLLKECFNYGICGYEISTHLAKESSVIIADYAHILNPSIKSPFLKKIAHKLSNSILIWDEAHNIIDLAAKYSSTSITLNGITRAEKELGKIGSNVDMAYLRFALEKIAKRKLVKLSEAFVERSDMPEEINTNSEEISSKLYNVGLEYLEKFKAGHSSIIHIAKFIESWNNAGESFIRIISREGSNLRISITSLYPEGIAETFKEAYANVFMSATLVPLSMYRDLLSLENAEIKQYGTPFPASNKAVFVDGTATTKYESRSVQEYKKIAQKIVEIKNAIPGNVAAFFPGFETLKNVMRYINGEIVYAQRQSMNSVEIENLLERFKKETNALLLGVMGGSLSEGVDYPSNLLKGVIIVGVPLSKPDLETRARISYYDKRFKGKGFEYAYIIPAIIKGMQAAGRAIRSETDKAVIVFMDKRYNWPLYSTAMQGSAASYSTDYIKKISDFWSKDENITKHNK